MNKDKIKVCFLMDKAYLSMFLNMIGEELPEKIWEEIKGKEYEITSEDAVNKQEFAELKFLICSFALANPEKFKPAIDNENILPSNV